MLYERVGEIGELPLLGMGLYRVEAADEMRRVLEAAWEAGYRWFDTAAFYANEEILGQALKDLGCDRESYVLTTKVWTTPQREGRVREAALESLDRLGLDYVDLLLLHWPVRERLEENYEALLKLKEEGRCRAVGVANFLMEDLQRLEGHGLERPVLNQFEIHPRLPRPALVGFCKEYGILPQAYCPIMRGRLSNEPLLRKLSERYGKSPAQIILRWHLQHGVSAIPKSSHPERIRENIDLFDFDLTDAEMADIDALETGERICDDPRDFSF